MLRVGGNKHSLSSFHKEQTAHMFKNCVSTAVLAELITYIHFLCKPWEYNSCLGDVGKTICFCCLFSLFALWSLVKVNWNRKGRGVSFSYSFFKDSIVCHLKLVVISWNQVFKAEHEDLTLLPLQLIWLITLDETFSKVKWVCWKRSSHLGNVFKNV